MYFCSLSTVMPFPFIFGAVAAVGAVQAASGMLSIKKAEQIGKRAQKQYELAVNRLKADWEATNQLAQKYGQLQLDVNKRTIGRFVALIKQRVQRDRQCEAQFLAGLRISAKQFKQYQAVALKAEDFFAGGATATLAGVAASQGVVALVGLFGTASTGTAISSLGGAAAWNATLAWLGGGSLAAGGGGMALGTLVLGGIAVGSALMVGGFFIAGKGEEALRKAQEYEIEINTAITTIKAEQDFLKQVRQRLIKLTELLRDLNNRAIKSLNELESQPFENNRDASKLQQVALLIKTIKKIQNTPVLNKQGKLNPATNILLRPELLQRVEQEQKAIQIAQRTGKVLAVLMVLGFGSWISWSATKMIQNPPHPVTVGKQAQADL